MKIVVVLGLLFAALVSGADAAGLGGWPTLTGSEIRFDVVRKGSGDDLANHFKGRVEGETMKLSMQFSRRNPIEITGRRVPNAHN